MIMSGNKIARPPGLNPHSTSTSTSTAMAPAPEYWPAEPLQQVGLEWKGLWANLINPATSWTSPVVHDWELRSAGWQDLHQHDELNYILAGELHVECNGHVLVLRAGDLVRVPGGLTSRYWAPEYARMISMYGPTPDGLEIEDIRYWDVDREEP